MIGIWSTRWLLFLVMSNIPKIGHLPTPVLHPQHPRHPRNAAWLLSSSIDFKYMSNICPYHIHTTRTFFKEKLQAGLSAYPAGSRNVKDGRRILEFWRFMEIISNALCCGLSPMFWRYLPCSHAISLWYLSPLHQPPILLWPSTSVSEQRKCQGHNGHNHNLFGNPAVVHWCLRFLLSSLLANPRKHGSRTKKHTWQCVKTLYPCSSHQNSWDLWMFIP